MTEKETKRILQSIKKLCRCSGDCKNCPHCQMKFAKDERITYFAFYCDIDKDIQPYSNTAQNLKEETLNALNFEIKGV